MLSSYHINIQIRVLFRRSLCLKISIRLWVFDSTTLSWTHSVLSWFTLAYSCISLTCSCVCIPWMLSDIKGSIISGSFLFFVVIFCSNWMVLSVCPFTISHRRDSSHSLLYINHLIASACIKLRKLAILSSKYTLP